MGFEPTAYQLPAQVINHQATCSDHIWAASVCRSLQGLSAQLSDILTDRLNLYHKTIIIYTFSK